MRSFAAAVALVTPFLIGAALAPDDPDRDVVWKFADAQINEASGLVVTQDRVITVNDSGDSARLFVVDLANGRTTGVTSWDAAAVDTEAIAPAGDGSVWVGDIGDNLTRRDDLTVTRVSVGDGDRAEDAETFPVNFGEARDAEALLAHPLTGRLYVVSKEIFGGQFFAAPQKLSASGPNRLRPIGDATPIVTDGAFFPDGRHVILRGYAQASVLTFPGLKTVDSFDLPRQPQGEGIAVAPDGVVYAGTEGRNAQLLRIALPKKVRAAIAPEEADAGGEGSRGEPGAEETGPTSPSGEQTRDPEDEARDRALRWALGGVLGLGIILVLLRALRPH